jgi:CRISPR system Cascade subunit CasD
MPAFLCFTLFAPLASFGDVAVGERRLSLERPGRSAVLGLVAAALGIERRDQPALDALAASLLVAVHGLCPGALLEDYHTAQVPPARRRGGGDVRHATRRDELAAPGLGTILSRRDYRQQPWHEVALFAGADATVALATVEAALRAPRFVLYHGRKSCPLGLPPDPQLVRQDDLGAALAAYEQASVARRMLAQAGRGPAPDTLYADIGLAGLLGPGWRVDRIVERRDAAGDRRRWQFTVRQELVASSSGDAP